MNLIKQTLASITDDNIAKIFKQIYNKKIDLQIVELRQKFRKQTISEWASTTNNLRLLSKYSEIKIEDIKNIQNEFKIFCERKNRTCD
jgi:hypothetical protein